MNANNEYKGFSLFNDIEDDILRIRNRAVVLANLAEDNTENLKVSMKGASLIFGYFNLVPPHEKFAVQQKFEEQMRARGFKVPA
jgi:hypothetical protein